MAETPSIAPIVVGVSRRSGSPAAVRFAVDEAGMRGCGVLAVTAWRPPKPAGAGGNRPTGFPDISPATLVLAEQDRIEASLVNALGSDLASLGVRFEVRRGSAAAVLLDAARNAQLLVLDSPRAGVVSSVGKGWIAPSVIYRARCPVVVMPPERDDTGRSRIRDRVMEATGAPDTAGRPDLRSVPPLTDDAPPQADPDELPEIEPEPGQEPDVEPDEDPREPVEAPV